jgi:Xaa-Pro aminopeptidase
MSPEDFAIPHEEFAERRQKFAKLLRARDLPAALVWAKGGGNMDLHGPVYYFSNHYSQFPQLEDSPPLWSGRAHSAVVITADGKGILVSDIPDYRADLIAADEVRVSLDVPGEAAEALKAGGITGGRIGLVARDTMLVGAYERLREQLPDAEWVPCEHLFGQVRMIKSPNEIHVIRKACEIGAKTCVAMMEAVEPGRTEAEIMAEALYVLTREGGMIYDHPAASGPHSRHYAYGRLPSWDHYRKLEPGDIFHVDMYGGFEGYFYDFGRSTVAGGKATDAQKEVLEGAIGAVEASIAAIRPGATAAQVAQAGFDWLTDHGFRIAGTKEELDAEGEATLNMTFPSMGHSLGMWWENPWLVPDDHTVLETGMIIAVERAVGRIGAGSASYEDDVLVTGDGCEILTPVRKRWWT